MSEELPPIPPYDPAALKSHKRRPRYRGTHPRKFNEKYKELDPEKYSATVERVIASGKTPAGTHRSIMVAEILEALAPRSGEIAVDCTLGYGGHSREILKCILPRGRLIGLDADSIELPKTEARMRSAGFGVEVFTAHRSNFAGLPKVLAQVGLTGVDLVLADLGVSSMQIDDPTRGFSVKLDGPLDMRMNPQRGLAASELLKRVKPECLVGILSDNSDEPNAVILGEGLAGGSFSSTQELVGAISKLLPKLDKAGRDMTIRRVFQAIRIEVNDEFSALESLLRLLPSCLKPNGRVAILTFHSGEDRRVKKAFAAGFCDRIYTEISREVIRPTPAERNSNPRSGPAKLRWAKRAAG